jgi:tetratricopeptide (TPR) repeat protein
MKRCPKCRRDYYDETLIYCLDDGSPLLDGPGATESPTAVFPVEPTDDARHPARVRIGGGNRTWIWVGALGLVVAAIAGYWILSPSARPKETKKAPNPEAYDKYLRAKVILNNENRGDLDAAIGLLESATKIDPDFAPAWATVARAYSIKAFYFAPRNEQKGLTENAEVAVARSLVLDPNLAEGHLARGLLLWTHAKRFPHEQSVQSYKRAIELDPTLDEAHHQLGVIYFHLGLFDKARAEIGKALELNSGNTLARFRYGVIDMYSGQYEEALAFFKSTSFEQAPSLQTFQIATALFKLGRVQEATQLLDEYLRDNPNDEGGVATSVKAMIFAKDGDGKRADEAIARAIVLGKDFGHFHHTAYNVAVAYALMHKPEEAVNYLQMAADDGFPCYPLFAQDRDLDAIRHDARFVTFLAKSKQQWERYNATL